MNGKALCNIASDHVNPLPPADVTNLLGDHSCHLVTVPPFGVAILFHAFVLISDSFSYRINPLAIPYVKVDYVVILRINFVLASNNSCISVRTPSAVRGQQQCILWTGVLHSIIFLLNMRRNPAPLLRKKTY